MKLIVMFKDHENICESFLLLFGFFIIIRLVGVILVNRYCYVLNNNLTIYFAKADHINKDRNAEIS